MKKSLIILLTSVFFLTTQAFAQKEAAEALKQDLNLKTPRITFAHNAYNFKTIKADEVVNVTFHFKNTGTKPLQIYDVQTTCGCTLTDWDREVVHPNAVGKISVSYHPAKKQQLGKQQKVVLIISNAINREEKVYLVGEVLK
ncbi:DUF1573 domain-containing protein [Microscilla marina]|uniref:Lipoprotein n=1 Tax=Microscilla marina ATCC 23134 TaxID=313606 RepID=A1ZHV4_MICM2|nr:DUF1573 domain-containing protein [Microscilla marina]EAY30111.1 conserved hypothetical protein [Microscilla marina ATCC 23134]